MPAVASLSFFASQHQRLSETKCERYTPADMGCALIDVLDASIGLPQGEGRENAGLAAMLAEARACRFCPVRKLARSSQTASVYALMLAGGFDAVRDHYTEISRLARKETIGAFAVASVADRPYQIMPIVFAETGELARDAAMAMLGDEEAAEGIMYVGEDAGLAAQHYLERTLRMLRPALQTAEVEELKGLIPLCQQADVAS